MHLPQRLDGPSLTLKDSSAVQAANHSFPEEVSRNGTNQKHSVTKFRFCGVSQIALHRGELTLSALSALQPHYRLPAHAEYPRNLGN